MTILSIWYDGEKKLSEFSSFINRIKKQKLNLTLTKNLKT